MNILHKMKHYKHIGEKFGKLTILERTGTNKNGAAIVSCLCDCGIIKNVCFTNLHPKGTTSCGCHHKQIIASKRPWETEFKRYISTTVKKRNLTFNLTIDEFKKICQQHCFYCGQAPSTKMHVSNGLKNGIDRIDSTIGYEINNVVPCCRICNDMKGALSKELFLSKIKDIVNHLNCELSI